MQRPNITFNKRNFEKRKKKGTQNSISLLEVDNKTPSKILALSLKGETLIIIKDLYSALFVILNLIKLQVLLFLRK